jgi:acyl carrier protein
LEDQLIRELGVILDKPVDPREDLVESGLDSFATMQVIAYLEDTFGIEVPEERLPIENFHSVRVIIAWAQPMINSVSEK